MNLKLIDFAFLNVRRRWRHHVLIVLIFMFLTFTLFTLFSISDALQYELNATLDELPELIVQRLQAGRQMDIPADRAYEIATIAGVTDVYPRVWGYYYFDPEQVNFTVIGLDRDIPSYAESFKEVLRVLNETDSHPDSIYIAGAGIITLLKTYGLYDELHLISSSGKRLRLKPHASFTKDVSLFSNDILLISEQNARQLFLMSPDMATDIVVRIPNKTEIDVIKRKIQYLYPDSRIVSSEDLKTSYAHLFNYKTGLFLAFFIPALLAFSIILIDRGMGLSHREAHEIGILKAIGWTSNTIIYIKLIESLYISVSSILLGSVTSYIYVNCFNAPVFLNLFSATSSLQPEFGLNYIFNIPLTLFVGIIMISMFTVVSIFPAWHSASAEPSDMLK